LIGDRLVFATVDLAMYEVTAGENSFVLESVHLVAGKCLSCDPFFAVRRARPLAAVSHQGPIDGSIRRASWVLGCPVSDENESRTDP
jgi:hypothetical protein